MFRKGNFYNIADFHGTDLVICSHIREGKNLSYSCVNTVLNFCFLLQGAPHATYDKLVFTELLDLRSTSTSPSWKDGFKVIIVIHFYQNYVVTMDTNDNVLKYWDT